MGEVRSGTRLSKAQHKMMCWEFAGRTGLF